jgi:dolichyl-phosphate-mannose--protein O-mannosyl transferase
LDRDFGADGVGQDESSFFHVFTQPILTTVVVSPEEGPIEAPPRVSPAPAPPRSKTQSLRWTWRDRGGLLALALLAGWLRFFRLGWPPGVIFDETYYAKDACLYLGLGQKFCKAGQATEQSYVHPPLGKWLISIGIKIFGYNAFGWRFAAAVFGTGLVLLAYVLARKLFRDRFVAGVAGFLAATDFLLIVQSRVAMLDIFQAFFVLLGFVFLAYDRERILLLRENYLLPFPGPRPNREREWRFAAGACMGLATAVKWSGLWAIAGAAALALSWSLWLIRAERHAARAGRIEPGFSAAKEFLNWAVAFMLIPVVVYLTVYSVYFIDRLKEPCAFRVPAATSDNSRFLFRGGRFGLHGGECRAGVAGVAAGFLDLQQHMLDFHTRLTATHPYQSPAWKWPLILRPTAYYFTGPPQTHKAHHILAFADPVVWYAALGALVYALARSARRWRPERFVAAGWLAQFLPWLAFRRPAIFFFYMTPIAAFMMVALAAALGAFAEEGRWAKRAVLGYLAVTVVLLYYFYPVLVGTGLKFNLWQSRMWYRSWI